jgi:hypothetical protein
MTAIPLVTHLADPNVQEVDFQQALTDLINYLHQSPGGNPDSMLTISAGSVTPTQFSHEIETEGGAATDDLTTIDQTNIPDGGLLLITPVNTAHTVVVKHNVGGTGKILTDGAADFTMDGNQKLLLRRKGATWVEVFRTVTIPAIPPTSVGVKNLWIPAGFFEGVAAYGPPTSQKVEFTTNDHNARILWFDPVNEERVTCDIALPKSWNRGNLKIRVFWTAQSGTGGVAWQLYASAMGDGEALDAGWGSGVTVTDTFLGANLCHVTGLSGDVVVNGSPQIDDLIHLMLRRSPSNGSDTLAQPAGLIGVMLTLTTDAGTDA